MKTTIKVEPSVHDWDYCDYCKSCQDLFCIEVGDNEYEAGAITLCKKCFKEEIKKWEKMIK